MSVTRAKTLSFVVIGAALIVAIVGLTIARAKLKPAVAQATANQSPVVRGSIQNVRFTLYDAGIFPQQQRARPGNVTINLEDRTHRSTGLLVQVKDDANGAVIGRVSAGLDRARGSTQFSLGVGHYAVFDASQPNNRAELVIEP